MNLDEYPDFLKCKEVASILKIHPSSVTRLISKKIIVATKTFGGWRIPAAELKRAIDRELNRQKVS